jgi:CubicO group peptidase (beta-lactamase class C family)
VADAEHTGSNSAVVLLAWSLYDWPVNVWFALALLCLACAGGSTRGEPAGVAGTGGAASTGGAAGDANAGGAHAGGGNASGAGGGNAGGAHAGAGNAGGAHAGVGNAGGAHAGAGNASGAHAGGGNGGVPAGVVGELQNYLGDARYPDSFWQAATFEESRMDAALLDAALARIAASRWELHSLLVARDGKLVVERYGWNQGANPDNPGMPHQTLPSEPHPIWSSTKSFLSALFGIALGDGLIPGVDGLVKDWFSDFAQLNPSPAKEGMTLEDLLTMRSGLELTEPDSKLGTAADAAREALSRTIVTPPGEVWNYSSGNSAILAEILRAATGRTPLEFANERLFAPIGIPSPSWTAGNSGTQHGGFGLSLTTREMARFGELYRNRGIWAGKSVVPEDWVEASTEPRCASDWGGQYAYHWWVPEPELPGFFNALGAWGQFIYVSRPLGLVIVVTGERPNDTAKTEIQSLISEFIVPAAR